MGSELSAPTARRDFPLYFVPSTLVAHVPCDFINGKLFANDFTLDDLVAVGGVDVDIPAKPPASSLWVPITLDGITAQVYQTFMAVEQRVEEVDDVVLQFRALKSRLPGLFGAISEIGADSGARIHVPSAEETLDLITLEGTIDQVAMAFELVQEYLTTVGRKRGEVFLPIPPSDAVADVADATKVSIAASGHGIVVSGAADAVVWAQRALEMVHIGQPARHAINSAHIAMEEVGVITAQPPRHGRK